MNILYKIVFILPVLLLGNNVRTNQILSPHLQDFDQFIGKTYKGEFLNSTPDKPLYDISKWERALNGNAIKITHSVNNGEYGGETFIMWDSSEKGLVSWYFTTAGFMHTAFVELTEKKYISVEDVSNNQNGIKKVKTTIELMPNGDLISSVKYLINQSWVAAHELIYYQDEGANVIFK